ncbi:hypothetical protein KC726_05310 [Candidatus Woesebacteria bacterium]|nr:hypothetical protein [Candidatus Woesebacteria bacterium]
MSERVTIVYTTKGPISIQFLSQEKGLLTPQQESVQETTRQIRRHCYEQVELLRGIPLLALTARQKNGYFAENEWAIRYCALPVLVRRGEFTTFVHLPTGLIVPRSQLGLLNEQTDFANIDLKMLMADAKTVLRLAPHFLDDPPAVLAANLYGGRSTIEQWIRQLEIAFQQPYPAARSGDVDLIENEYPNLLQHIQNMMQQFPKNQIDHFHIFD